MDSENASQYGLAFLDANADGHVTIRDLWDSFLTLVFLPGDQFISLLSTYLPAAARFLELGPEDHGTALSKFIAAGIWIAIFIASGTVISALRDFDRALTARVGAMRQEFLRRLRVIRRRLALTLSHFGRRTVRDDGVTTGTVSLDKIETAVLKCYAGREEARILAPGEIARALKLSQRRVNTALTRLLDLRLVEPSRDTTGAILTHQISQAGQIYLIDL